MGYRFRMYVDDKTKDEENERIAFAYLHWHGAMHSSVPLTIMVANGIRKAFENIEFSTNSMIRDRQLKDIVAHQLIKNTTLYDRDSEVILDEIELYICQIDLEAAFHINIHEDYSITIDHEFGVFYKLDLENEDFGYCGCDECESGTYCTNNFRHSDNQEKIKQLPVVTLEQPFVDMTIEQLYEIWENTSDDIIQGNAFCSYLFFNVNGDIYKGY